MNKKTKNIYFIMFCFFIISCSSYNYSIDKTNIKSEEKKIYTFDSTYKKKVGIIPFLNYTNFRDTKIEDNINSIILNKILKERENILLINNKDFYENFSKYFFLNKSFINLNYKDLLNTSREKGLDFVIFQHINNVDTSGNSLDYLNNKREICKKKKLKFEFVTTIIDIKNSTVLFRLVKEIDCSFYEKLSKFSFDKFNKYLYKTAEEMGSLLVKKIILEEWSSVVFSALDDKLVLSVGSEIGIKKEDQFLIYARNRNINGFKNRPYLICNQKIGKILVTDVDTNLAKAIFFGKKIPFSGDIIRLK